MLRQMPSNCVTLRGAFGAIYNTPCIPSPASRACMLQMVGLEKGRAPTSGPSFVQLASTNLIQSVWQRSMQGMGQRMKRQSY